jgi:hypothetical protein
MVRQMDRWWIFNVLCRRRDKQGKLLRKQAPPPASEKEIFWDQMRRYALPDGELEKRWQARQQAIHALERQQQQVKQQFPHFQVGGYGR